MTVGSGRRGKDCHSVACQKSERGSHWICGYQEPHQCHALKSTRRNVYSRKQHVSGSISQEYYVEGCPQYDARGRMCRDRTGGLSMVLARQRVSCFCLSQLKCQNHPENVTKISHWKDFSRLAVEGGCQELCGQKLPCGHICRRSVCEYRLSGVGLWMCSSRRCHITNREHTENDCPVLVSVELPCGHVQHKVPCHK